MLRSIIYKYMIILAHHEKYGRKYNFLRRDRELYYSRRDQDFHFINLIFRDKIEITYCNLYAWRRERETQVEFLKVNSHETENSC